MKQPCSQGHPHHAGSQVPFPEQTSLCPQLNQNTQQLGRLPNSLCLIMDFPTAGDNTRVNNNNRGVAFAGELGLRQLLHLRSHWYTRMDPAGSKGSSPAPAQEGEYHLGRAFKDTSNRSTIILHVSILKPSDLISWPVKKEQKTGLSLHAVPQHLPK